LFKPLIYIVKNYFHSILKSRSVKKIDTTQTRHRERSAATHLCVARGFFADKGLTRQDGLPRFARSDGGWGDSDGGWGAQ
jgi:hypothetical protein